MEMCGLTVPQQVEQAAIAYQQQKTDLVCASATLSIQTTRILFARWYGITITSDEESNGQVQINQGPAG